MPVQVLGKTSARRSTEVQSDVHSLRVEGVLAQVHGQLHQPPEVPAIRWGVGVDGGLGFAERHQQMAVGVRVPIEEHHAAGIAVDDLLLSIAVWVRPVVRQEVGAARRRRCLGGVDLRFKGADVGHSPGCPKGRVHDRSVGNEICGNMKFMMIQCDPRARAEGTEWTNEGALAALGENSKKYFWYLSRHSLSAEFQSGTRVTSQCICALNRLRNSV